MLPCGFYASVLSIAISKVIILRTFPPASRSLLRCLGDAKKFSEADVTFLKLSYDLPDEKALQLWIKHGLIRTNKHVRGSVHIRPMCFTNLFQEICRHRSTYPCLVKGTNHNLSPIAKNAPIRWHALFGSTNLVEGAHAFGNLLGQLLSPLESVVK
jgi:hypothetical protein